MDLLKTFKPFARGQSKKKEPAHSSCKDKIINNKSLQKTQEDLSFIKLQGLSDMLQKITF